MIELRLIEERPPAGDMLPFCYYDIISAGVAVGKISIRFGHNFHSYYNGHVGFEIFPEFRGNGYALQAARLVLGVAKARGMQEIYLTCKQSNTASRRIFETLGAAFVEVAKIPEACFFYRAGIEDYAVYRLMI